MGEVAVMHSEPLQFECNDMKLIKEKDVYNLPLPERGYMEYGYIYLYFFTNCYLRVFASLNLCENDIISSADVNITGEDVVLGLPVAMRYLIAAIVIMRQK